MLGQPRAKQLAAIRSFADRRQSARHFDMPDYYRQEIVEMMCDAAGPMAESCHFLRLTRPI